VLAAPCDRVALTYAGGVVADGPTARVYARPSHPYTRLLLGAFPDIDRPGRPLTGIAGAPPRLTDLPPGCRFHPRCPDAMARCSDTRPPSYAIDEATVAACLLHDDRPEVDRA
jgi:oligopeptide/dipeptide ABC transporter ATP-binding protein